MRYRRPLLGFVLGAIVVTAALGLWAVLAPGEFGDLQAKVLGTSAAISGASIVLLAFVPAWERELLRPLPVVGAALTFAALALGLVGLWVEPNSEAYGKAMGTVMFLAAWALLACLLALATLPRRYRWVFAAAVGLTLALVAVGIGAMWVEPDEAITGRVAGALAVLSAAFVLTVPVLARASRGELATAEDQPAAGFCPRCGAQVAVAATDEPATCGRCGARFRVSYLETLAVSRARDQRTGYVHPS